ncbi:MAG TPA: hypothetical protein VH744_02400, partial [Terriglobales bacterium]
MSLYSNVLERVILPGYATGGSSGQPTRLYITFPSYDWRSAVSTPAYSWSSHRLGEPTLFLWGGPVGETPRWQQWKLRLLRTVRNEVVLSTFSQSEKLWGQVLETTRRLRPKVIVGDSSLVEIVPVGSIPRTASGKRRVSVGLPA